jgi:transcriptional regulator of acetoin/glycerol metabolism
MSYSKKQPEIAFRKGDKKFFSKKTNTLSLRKVLDSMEKAHIEKVLKMTNGNLQQSGRLLGICRNTLKTKMRYFGMRKN